MARSLLDILIMLVTLAVSDSVNPCTIYLYTTLLLAASISSARGQRYRKNILYTALGFIGSVYIGYYLLGVGLTTILSYLPEYLFSIIAIVFGVWVIVSGIMEKSRIAGKGLMTSMIRKARASVIMSIALGFTATFTLLPCSAGPYVVFAALISKLEMWLSLLLLALYNAIFVAPLVAVTLIAVNVTKIRTVRDFIIKHNPELSVVSGILLILIGIYAYLYS